MDEQPVRAAQRRPSDQHAAGLPCRCGQRPATPAGVQRRNGPAQRAYYHCASCRTDTVRVAGTACGFCSASDGLASPARARRTKVDWALEVARLLDGRYADCPKHRSLGVRPTSTRTPREPSTKCEPASGTGIGSSHSRAQGRNRAAPRQAARRLRSSSPFCHGAETRYRPRARTARCELSSMKPNAAVAEPTAEHADEDGRRGHRRMRTNVGVDWQMKVDRRARCLHSSSPFIRRL